jgi:hypothetical protein
MPPSTMRLPKPWTADQAKRGARSQAGSSARRAGGLARKCGRREILAGRGASGLEAARIRRLIRAALAACRWLQLGRNLRSLPKLNVRRRRVTMGLVAVTA